MLTPLSANRVDLRCALTGDFPRREIPKLSGVLYRLYRGLWQPQTFHSPNIDALLG